jgi:hypothetical protein
MSIYSYCNVHDISWGTKGIEAAHGPKAGDGKKKKAQVADTARKRGDSVQLKADEEAAVIAQQREESKKQILAKEKAGVQASFQAFRSYLVIAWIASNALYVGMMFGFINQKPVDTAPAHFYICTDAAAVQKALAFGMGVKGGEVKISSVNNQEPCLQHALSLNMEFGSYLVEPVKSTATCPSAIVEDAQPECCTSVDEILNATPAQMSAAQIYLIMLFGLVIYTLGLKLIFSVLFLVDRHFANIYHGFANKQRRLDDVRRQEMVGAVASQQDSQLSEGAIAAGWSTQIDPATGRTYYQNVSTGQTDWVPPNENALL